MVKTEPALVEAFTATRYLVTLSRVTHALGIDQPMPTTLRTWCEQRAFLHQCWLVTADNPQGQDIAVARNLARRERLCQIIDERGWARLACHNVDPHGQWPDEHGWLIAAAEESQVRAVMARFDQAAVVGLAGGVPALLWLS